MNLAIRLIENVAKLHFAFHLSMVSDNISRHTICLALLRINFCKLKASNLIFFACSCTLGVLPLNFAKLF